MTINVINSFKLLQENGNLFFYKEMGGSRPPELPPVVALLHLHQFTLSHDTVH